MPGIRIWIDADACPVKDETYKVAERYGVPVSVVANQYMRVPREDWLDLVVVSDGFDAADDHIAENCDGASVVITADILLAERCIKRGATVIGSNGKPFTENSIGGAVASRALMNDLRAMGEVSGGPAPFSKADRSRYLQALDLAVSRLKRALS
ncbi:MAG: YaiI/YqxD family protein [Pseudomonadota bacterium]